MTITHVALDLTVQALSAPPTHTWDLTGQGLPQPYLPASDIWWPSLETCSNLFTSVNIWWLLKEVCWAQAGVRHPI